MSVPIFMPKMWDSWKHWRPKRLLFHWHKITCWSKLCFQFYTFSQVEKKEITYSSNCWQGRVHSLKQQWSETCRVTFGNSSDVIHSGG